MQKNSSLFSSFNLIMISTAYMSLFAMGLLDNTRGPSYPNIINTFKITMAEGSWIFTIASIAGLFVNLSAKWWLGYINPIRGIEISLVF